MKYEVEIPDEIYCDNNKEFCKFFTFGINEGYICSLVGELHLYDSTPDWYYHMIKPNDCPNFIKDLPIQPKKEN